MVFFFLNQVLKGHTCIERLSGFKVSLKFKGITNWKIKKEKKEADDFLFHYHLILYLFMSVESNHNACNKWIDLFDLNNVIIIPFLNYFSVALWRNEGLQGRGW